MGTCGEKLACKVEQVGIEDRFKEQDKLKRGATNIC